MQHENFILEIVKKQNMAFGADMHYGGICVHAFLWSGRGPGQQKRHILVGRAFIAANRAFDRLFFQLFGASHAQGRIHSNLDAVAKNGVAAFFAFQHFILRG